MMNKDVYYKATKFVICWLCVDCPDPLGAHSSPRPINCLRGRGPAMEMEGLGGMRRWKGGYCMHHYMRPCYVPKSTVRSVGREKKDELL